MPLTATAILNAKPGTASKRLYDSGGFYLAITPSGGRWWRFAYRFGGKRKLISLGVAEDVPLAEARKRRDDARKLLADGIDPSAKRRADKRAAEGRAANSFQAGAREGNGRQAHTWVETHASDVLRRLEATCSDPGAVGPRSAYCSVALICDLRPWFLDIGRNTGYLSRDSSVSRDLSKARVTSGGRLLRVVGYGRMADLAQNIRASEARRSCSGARRIWPAHL
jgi:hypothetical protein